jgi:quinoprotein glucose dehydrogenase
MTSRWIAAALLPLAACAEPKRDYSGWGAYGGGPEQLRYSSLRQITPANVNQLSVAWTYDTGADPKSGLMHSTPLLADGRLYVAGPDASIHAVNPATGERVWRYTPQAPGGDNGHFRGAPRGLMYWPDPAGGGRVLGINGRYVFAVNAVTGALIPDFRIDLREHLGRDAATQDAELGSPGAIYKDVLILGTRMGEALPTSPGHIRGYDVRTGALRWTFHTIPHPGEFGYDTWSADSWQYSGGANSWSGASLDEKRGIVFLATGSAASDFYGADRVGDNLFANSVIALNAETGARIWHQQIVRHDLWDRDLPAPPSLVTVTRNGRPVDAVLQTTKTGHLWLLHRETGEPLFPVDEIAVPGSDIPGEVAAKSQRVPRLPVPFANQRFSLTERTPDATAFVERQIKGLDAHGAFVPPSRRGQIIYPGFDGGGEWGGSAFDPETETVYVNANEVPWMLRMIEPPAREELTSASQYYATFCASCHGKDRRGSGDFPPLVDLGKRSSDVAVRDRIMHGGGRMPGFLAVLQPVAIGALSTYLLTSEDVPLDRHAAREQKFNSRFRNEGWPQLRDDAGYPGSAPPWGTLTAIDMTTGQHIWRTPLGEYPALAKQGQSNTGSENYGGPVVTAGGVVFIGATVFDRKFRAFDKATGRLLWQIELPAAGLGTPAVYTVNGRQFVVTPAGGPRNAGQARGASYVAFALPASR